MRLSTLHASRYLISYKIAKIPRVRALLAEDVTSKYPWSGFHVVAVGLGPRRTRLRDASRRCFETPDLFDADDQRIDGVLTASEAL